MSNKNKFNVNEQALNDALKQLRGVLNSAQLSDPERVIVLKDLLSSEENRQGVALKTMAVLAAIHSMGKR
jgi:hypothetical protein